MRARVVIVGSAGTVEQLTYTVPPELAGRVQCGHRVLVPMRSRRLTGLVTALGDDLDSGGVEPREILELLEARPLFDRAHIELIEFLASYYMAPIAEAYRNVIPAVARVESRLMFKRGAPPLPLALATMGALERAVIDAVARRPMTARQLERLGDRRAVEAALTRLTTEGLIERLDGTRGRHREAAPPLVRLRDGTALATMRGPRQRAVVEDLGANGDARLDALEAAIAGARTAVRALTQRGVGSNIHYPVPVHMQPAYRGRMAIGPSGLGESERAAREVLSLPIYPQLGDAAVARVVAALREVCS